MKSDTNSYKTISEKTYWLALSGLKAYREQLQNAARAAVECCMPDDVEYFEGRIAEINAAIAELTA